MNELPYMPAWPSSSRAQEWLRNRVPEPFASSLVGLVDGTRTVESIIGQLLADGFGPDLIWSTLRSLSASDYLAESELSPFASLSPEDQRRFQEHIRALAAFADEQESSLKSLPLTGVKAHVRQSRAQVLLSGDGRIAERLGEILRAAGMERIDHMPGEIPLAGDPSLVVFCPDRFDVEECRRLNRACLDRSVRLLPANFQTLEVKIGPLLVPRETACFECYWRRVQAARSGNDGTLDGEEEEDVPHLAILTGVDWLALEIVKIASEIAEPVTRGRLWRLDLMTGKAETHPVYRLPRCPACGLHRTRPLVKLWEE